jgi:ABC-2 type transport system ATP-binding protein
VIKAINCSKVIGTKKILDNINFEVRKGNIFGYLGPNGAGKTTTIRIAMGLMKPSGGSLHIFGSDIGNNGHLRQRVGILTENSGLYGNLSAIDNLKYFGLLYSVKNIEEKAGNLIKLVGLSEYTHQKAGTFSTGMKRKLSLAKSIINDPEVLFLDEPTAGLDPESQKLVRELILDLAVNRKITIFLTSHNLDEVQRICTHICILNRGKVVVNDSLNNLQAKYSKPAFGIKLSSRELAKKSSEIIMEANMASKVEIIEDSINIIDAKVGTNKLIRVLVENDIEVIEAARLSSSLEDIYLNIINK